jgi:ankyrin repeat protein
MSYRVIVIVFLLWSLSACTCGPEADDPFVAAASHGDLSEVKESLKVHGDVERRNPVGVTALIAAARSGHTDVADFLLGEEADVNARDYYDKTALEGAAAEGYIGIMKTLLAGRSSTSTLSSSKFAMKDESSRRRSTLQSGSISKAARNCSDCG